MRRLAPAVLATLLAGCAARTPSPAPASLAEARALPPSYGASADAGGAAELMQWWRRFDDPVLTRLVGNALIANQDIAQAAARVAEARAGYAAAGAARLPTLAVSGALSHVTSQPAAAAAPRTTIDGALSLDWNPDLFGGQRHGQRASRADLAAAGYDLADVQRLVVAELADNYVDYRALTARIANAEAALDAQRRLLDVIRHRFDSGIAVAADVEQARLQLFQVQSLLPDLRDARARAANRIAVLTGRPPGQLGALLDGPARIPGVARLPATGVPADLLRRRPDVRAAEQRLLAAAEQRGVARADLLPRLSLGGVISATAFSLPMLAQSLVSTLIGGIGQTLFDDGAGRARLQGREAATREALGAYRATILAAMEDVENALSAVDDGADRVRIDTAAADAAQRNAELTRGQYDIGLTDLFILLDAEQQLHDQRDALIAAQGEQAQAEIALYVALGGGG